MQAKIVVGMGFGDEGKGKTVDYLCKTSKDPIVVRFSGGQQAGHTVIIEGTKHIHSNFGSGTLRGFPSYFTEHCTMYPATFFREMTVFFKRGMVPGIVFHPLVKITTPYDMAWNVINEENRAHGTCGLGVGATMKRNEGPYKLYAVDLLNKEVTKQKLGAIRDYYADKLKGANGSIVKKFNEIGEKDIQDFWKGAERVAIEDYTIFNRYHTIIFEGSQGIMLDKEHGIFPNVTYANTTSRNAVEVCKNLEIPYEVYYITRAYQTRHGSGWMSNNNPLTLINTEEEINVFNDYQKDFRVGEIDYDLLNLALSYDKIYSGYCRRNLVVNCLDQVDKPFDYTKLRTAYTWLYESHSPESVFKQRHFSRKLNHLV